MKKKSIVISGIIAGVLLIGGAFAYFSGTAEQKQNNFTVVAGGQAGPIKITEPEWDKLPDTNNNKIPDKAEDIEPGQLVTKDPCVESICDYDGWVVMKVSVPTISAQKNTDTKDKVYDVFTLAGYDTPEGFNSDDFVALTASNSVSTATTKKSVYYYGYKKVLKAHDITPPLFKKLKMQEFVMISAAKKDSVDIDAVIIQKINPSTGEEFKNVQEAFDIVTDHKNVF